MKPFSRLDADMQMLIRERNPKLQPRERFSLYNQNEDGKVFQLRLFYLL